MATNLQIPTTSAARNMSMWEQLNPNDDLLTLKDAVISARIEVNEIQCEQRDLPEALSRALMHGQADEVARLRARELELPDALLAARIRVCERELEYAAAVVQVIQPVLDEARQEEYAAMLERDRATREWQAKIAATQNLAMRRSSLEDVKLTQQRELRDLQAQAMSTLGRAARLG